MREVNLKMRTTLIQDVRHNPSSSLRLDLNMLPNLSSEVKCSSMVSRNDLPKRLRSSIGFRIKNVTAFVSTLLIIVTSFCATITSLKGDSNFFEKHAEGWHWYEDRPQEEDLREAENSEEKASPISLKDDSTSGPISLSSSLATETIKSQRQQLEKHLHTAILNPTPQNLKAYIVLQRQMMDRSQRFAEEWTRVIMLNPELDETLTHPADQKALHVYHELKNKDIQAQLKSLSQEYGLFFFFKGECPYCHGMAPLVKSFSETYGWSVLAISLDGGSLKEFPGAKRDNGTATRLGITHVPALLAIHPKTGEIIPLAYGMVSESEIEHRVMMLEKKSSIKYEPRLNNF